MPGKSRNNRSQCDEDRASEGERKGGEALESLVAFVGGSFGRTSAKEGDDLAFTLQLPC